MVQLLLGVAFIIVACFFHVLPNAAKPKYRRTMRTRPVFTGFPSSPHRN